MIVFAGSIARQIHHSALATKPLADPGECATVLEKTTARTDEIARSSKRLQLALCEDSPSSVTTIPSTPEVLLADQRRRCPPTCCRATIWNHPLPPGALWRLRDVRDPDGRPLHCLSPEMDFLLACRRLTLAEALLRAFELCGCYRVTDESPDGFVSRAAPLTTPRKLRNFIDGVTFPVHGLPVARRAAGLTLTGAASPRESALTAMLVLPSRLGGYGMPAPELNSAVLLDEEARRILRGQASIRFDVSWPDRRTALEYDSDRWHLEAGRATEDRRRVIAGEALGYRVFSLTNGLVSDSASLYQVIRTLEPLVLGHRRRPQSAHLANLRLKRHGELFHRHLAIEKERGN